MCGKAPLLAHKPLLTCQVPVVKMAIHGHLGKADSHQRMFIYRLCPIFPQTDEPMYCFYRRRHLAANRLAEQVGKWIGLWAADLVKWRAHAERGHDLHAWSPKLLRWNGGSWLCLQRLWNSASGESRTNTRALRGYVHQRWEEGVEIAATEVSLA